MEKYKVTMKVEGFFEVEVDAENVDQLVFLWNVRRMLPEPQIYALWRFCVVDGKLY